MYRISEELLIEIQKCLEKTITLIYYSDEGNNVPSDEYDECNRLLKFINDNYLKIES